MKFVIDGDDYEMIVKKVVEILTNYFNYKTIGYNKSVPCVYRDKPRPSANFEYQQKCSLCVQG